MLFGEHGHQIGLKSLCSLSAIVIKSSEMFTLQKIVKLLMCNDKLY